jgi:hypothetical protein
MHPVDDQMLKRAHFHALLNAQLLLNDCHCCNDQMLERAHCHALLNAQLLLKDCYCCTMPCKRVLLTTKCPHLLCLHVMNISLLSLLTGYPCCTVPLL